MSARAVAWPLLIVLLGLPGLAAQERGWPRQAPAQQASPPQQPPSSPAQQPSPPQQSETPVFRAEAKWVRVDVQAGEKSRLLSDLTKDDFVVLDDGVPQTIDYFGRESEPLDVLLLLDVSGSMSRYLQQMAATAKQALAQLHSGDRVGVMAFARRAEVAENLTADRAGVESELREAVGRKDLGSGTLLNAAVIAAAEYMQKQPLAADGSGPRPGRRAILVVTDNMGLNYQVPDERVVASLYAADTVLNAIVVGKGDRPRPVKRGQYTNPDFTPSDVFHLAEETGGEAIKAQHAGESFRDMMESIRSRYSIQYRAPDAQPGTFRKIRVELSPAARKRYPNAWVRARAGYIAQ